MKTLCCKCKNIATWVYMPGGKDDYYCDGHVPRGCSCNLKPKDGDYENNNPDNWYQPLDDKNRELPCCEFDYSEGGFEK